MLVEANSLPMQVWFSVPSLLHKVVGSAMRSPLCPSLLQLTAIRLDLDRAYDCMAQDFLHFSLESFSFHNLWINFIYGYVTKGIYTYEQKSKTDGVIGGFSFLPPLFGWSFLSHNYKKISVFLLFLRVNSLNNIPTKCCSVIYIIYNLFIFVGYMRNQSE